MRVRAATALALCLIALSACIPSPQGERRPPPRPMPVPAQPAPIPPPAPRLPTDTSGLEAPPPAWIAKPVSPSAVTVQAQVYRVGKGDTLRAIAGKTGSSSELIALENHIPAPYVVKIGQKLRIPGGRFHLVERGQSGIAIARAYGVDWTRIVALNHLSEPFILREGMRLLLPSENEVDRMTVEQRAAAFRIDIDDILTGGEPALSENAEPARPVSTSDRTLPATAAISEPGGSFNRRIAWPVQGRIVRRFGILGNGQRSDGINIAAPIGTPIQAAADGVVAYVGHDVAIYGGLILIRHPDGWLSAYGHTDQINVKRGQEVKRGQAIGTVGEPGASMTEPQLHFELRQGRKPMNPMAYLAARS